LKDLPEDKAFYSSETRQELLLLLAIKDDVVMETVDPAFVHWLPGRTFTLKQELQESYEHQMWTSCPNSRYDIKQQVRSGYALLSPRNLKGELLLQGPVFIKEPSNSVFPVGSEDKKITLNCEARGNPSPHYRLQIKL
ncbi:hypothetical protein STEG23_033746, partial [Scotinomys teguina]